MTRLSEFIEVFDVWPEARAHLPLMVSEQEMELVLHLADGPKSVAELAELLGLCADRARRLIERAYERNLVDKRVAADRVLWTPATFSARLAHFAQFENFDDIPPADRRDIDRRFLQAFIAQHRSAVECQLRGSPAQGELPNDSVLLLAEAEEMIRAATDIAVLPCDCRRLGQRCDRPTDNCLWLNAIAREAFDRGCGRRLTREQALRLIRRCDRQGLMHTGDIDWRSRGLTAICNCCACDCYPFRAAVELGSKGVWPRSRYVAVHDENRCRGCGLCLKRCQFAAFVRLDAPPAAGEQAVAVSLAADACWGCGLCANTCPEGAIAMAALPAR